MDRFVRIAVFAVCGATLVWLAGCGGPPKPPKGPDGEKPSPGGVLAEIERRRAEEEQKAATASQAAAAAEKERAMAEAPSAIGKQDYEKGSKLTKGRINRALGGALRAGEDIQLKNIEHNLEIHAMAQGWPKSHEGFMKLVTQEWGMTLPPLADGYEYWYNADDHKIYKRPSVQGETAEP